MRSGVLGNFGWGLKVRSIIYVFASGTQHALFHSLIVFIIYATWRWSQDPTQPGSCCQAENVTKLAALSREQLDTCWQMGARKESYGL